MRQSREFENKTRKTSTTISKEQSNKNKQALFHGQHNTFGASLQMMI